MGSYAILKEDKDERQCTVSDVLFFKGIGLHTGKETSITIKPAKANSGILFIRKDVKPNAVIRADVSNICSTTLRTSIGSVKKVNGGILPGRCISTVEHLMSALWGAGIDNVLIEVYGGEIPAMDGSAGCFYDAFYESGIKKLGERRKYIEILKPIVVSNDSVVSDAGRPITNKSNMVEEMSIAVYPSNDFEISYSMDFDHPLVHSDSFDMKIDACNFHKEISKARTFGFLKDVEYMKKSGLALGGSLDNALVLDETSVLNKGGLRYKDEFIRHKVLDLIGDIYLSGYRIKGRVLAKRTGHEMNSKLVMKIGEHLVADIRKDEMSIRQSALHSSLSHKENARLVAVVNAKTT